MGMSWINWGNLGHCSKINFSSKAKNWDLHSVCSEHFLQLSALHKSIPAGLSISTELWFCLSSASRDNSTLRLQDVQMLFSPSWFFLQGFPWPRLAEVIRLQPAAKWQHAKQIYLLQPFGGSWCFKLQCVLTCTHVAGPWVAQQSAHPGHFSLATLQEDNISSAAISPRGCSQNHQGKELGGRFQCAVVLITAGFDAT